LGSAGVAVSSSGDRPTGDVRHEHEEGSGDDKLGHRAAAELASRARFRAGGDGCSAVAAKPVAGGERPIAVGALHIMQDGAARGTEMTAARLATSRAADVGRFFQLVGHRKKFSGRARGGGAKNGVRLRFQNGV